MDLHVLEPAAEWRAADVADPAAWTVTLTDDDHAELAAALAHAKAVSDDPLVLGREHFPLEGLAAKVDAAAAELIDGRGFVRFATLDVDRYDDDDLTLLYWGIGLHLGEPWPQNKHGHVLGDVTDQGKTLDDPDFRGNELGGVALDYHCDGADLVGLLCLRTARTGGLSCVANAVAIHNELVRTDPDLAAALYDEFAYDFRGEEKAGNRPWYLMPLFTERKGRLFVRYIRPYILSARRHADAPAPSEVATAAMDRVDAMCADPEFHLSMQLEPGDVQLVNNYHVLHARDAYTDDRATGAVRHLKRLWLETSVLTDDDKPEAFRLTATTETWWKAAQTAS